MREKRWYPIAYMFVISVFFSAIIITFAQVTQPRVQANARLALEQAVLTVFNLFDPDTTRLQMHQVFMENVEFPSEETAGAFALRRDGEIAIYAVPIEGQGFWAPILGMVGVLPDLETLTGIAFYEQNETPGLGAEIVRPVFRNQFEGMELRETERLVRMRRPGEPLQRGEFHAVTGATQTSVRLEVLINESLGRWLEQMREQQR